MGLGPDGRIKPLTEDDFYGFPLKDIKCRSCSGYGNCGYKTYGIYDGKVVSICIRTRNKLRRERGDILGEDEI